MGKKLNPLDNAIEFGRILAQRDVPESKADKVIKDFAFWQYHKPRAKRYRQLWIDSAVRGYMSATRELNEWT